MAKLKNPLVSLRASGTLGNIITFVTRGKVDIAERKPVPVDAHTSTQLAWRHMFNKCVDLWHELSAAEKVEWESAARPKHMTGYAWYISQCLRPNPGIYLPLQGGSMTGDVDMAKNRILRLPPPVDAQEAARKAEIDALVGGYTEGARVSYLANYSIPHATPTYLPFNAQTWDTDAIHDSVVNNSRLTCKTAGKYIIVATVEWEVNAAGWREIAIIINHAIFISRIRVGLPSDGVWMAATSAVYNLAVNDYAEVRAYQTSGGALRIIFGPQHTPEFMMQRIG